MYLEPNLPSLLVVAETGGIPSTAGVWELNSSFLCNFSVFVLLLLYSTDPCIGTLGLSCVSAVVPHQFLIFTDKQQATTFALIAPAMSSGTCVVVLPEPSFHQEQGGFLAVVVPSSPASQLPEPAVPCMAVSCFCECSQPSMSPLPHGHAGSLLTARERRCST